VKKLAAILIVLVLPGVFSCGRTKPKAGPSDPTTRATEACKPPPGLSPDHGRFGEADGPRPTTRVRPSYPMKAKARRIEGCVLLELTVDASGEVVGPRVLDAYPRGMFDKAALRAVAKWQYEPRKVDGKPVSTEKLLVLLKFNLGREDGSG